MARVDEYTLVQNALVDKFRAGPYYKVVVDDNHKFARVAVTPATNPVTYQTAVPFTVLADEVSASFGPAHTQRTAKDDYASWVWQVVLSFNEKVVLHEFHYQMCENFVLIPSGTVAGVRQATARLQAAPQIQHPQDKQGPNGTKVTYTINVRLQPL